MSIEDWRREIDGIDMELMRLLNMRARLAIKVGTLKNERALPLRDRERESEILLRVQEGNTDRCATKS